MSATHRDPVRLIGERVVLRDWVPTDLEPLRNWLQPHQRWRDTNGPYFPRKSAAQQDAFAITTVAGADQPDPRTSLAVVDAVDGRLVGRVNWYWECQETDWRRIALAVYDPARWGHGIGTEALVLWTGYLFDRTDALRLDFATYSGNPGMLAVGSRAGYTEEARLRQARRWAGGVHDAVIMGVLRAEWMTTREPVATPNTDDSSVANTDPC